MPGASTFYTTQAVVASPAAAAETVVATLANVTIPVDGNRVVLSGWVNILPDAASTAAILRVRRGTVAGALVGVSQSVDTVAGILGEMSIKVADVPDDSPGATYVLTLQMTAGAAPTVVNGVDLTARVD